MNESAMRPSGTPPFWEPGTTILWRYRRKTPGHIGPETVRPMTVVRDDADALVAWLAPGTAVLRPVLPDGRELRSVPAHEMFTAGRALRRDLWKGPGVLNVAPTGQPWSVWLFWDDAWAFRGWYVNLEAVHERDTRSVASQDRVLDLWVDADRTIHWKDEDELEAAVAVGRVSATDAEEWRADARAVEQLVRGWASPFNERWEEWRPDPAWPVPELAPDLTWDFA